MVIDRQKTRDTNKGQNHGARIVDDSRSEHAALTGEYDDHYSQIGDDFSSHPHDKK